MSIFESVNQKAAERLALPQTDESKKKSMQKFLEGMGYQFILNRLSKGIYDPERGSVNISALFEELTEEDEEALISDFQRRIRRASALGLDDTGSHQLATFFIEFLRKNTREKFPDSFPQELLHADRWGHRENGLHDRTVVGVIIDVKEPEVTPWEQLPLGAVVPEDRKWHTSAQMATDLGWLLEAFDVNQSSFAAYVGMKEGSFNLLSKPKKAPQTVVLRALLVSALFFIQLRPLREFSNPGERKKTDDALARLATQLKDRDPELFEKAKAAYQLPFVEEVLHIPKKRKHIARAKLPKRTEPTQ